MKKCLISFMVFWIIMLGIGLTNVSMLIRSAVADACLCPQGCPCSHCEGKSSVCNCRK